MRSFLSRQDRRSGTSNPRALAEARALAVRQAREQQALRRRLTFQAAAVADVQPVDVQPADALAVRPLRLVRPVRRVRPVRQQAAQAGAAVAFPAAAVVVAR
jgi:hypothetical protein